MKRRFLFSAQIALFSLFIISLLIIALRLLGNANPLAKLDQDASVYNRVEAYDPSLKKLNSLRKIEEYCDSIYADKAFKGGPVDFQRTYTDIVSTVIRNRFYHGYSYYGMTDNFMATLISKVTIPGLSALVIPDEILKHPYAACSQQSIVMMEILKDRGFKTRKVGFQGKKFGGHFAFEVFYDGGWHFHDPNLEPDKSVLSAYGRPCIAFLVNNPDILLSAYRRYPREKIMDIFPTYFYGPVNTFPAPRAIIFQKVTQFLSYTAWLFFLVGFLLARRSYSRFAVKMYALNGRKLVRIPRRETAPIYYPEYPSAQGA